MDVTFRKDHRPEKSRVLPGWSANVLNLASRLNSLLLINLGYNNW
jgi:hypothetical protein